MNIAEDNTALSEGARTAMTWLEYLTQVLPDTPALPASTLLLRAGLSDLDDHPDVIAELERAGLIASTPAGVMPTGAEWDRVGYLASDAVFAYDLDDSTEIHLPTSWVPTTDALAAGDYSTDYLLEYLGLLVIAAAHLSEDGRITIGTLRQWSRDPVQAVLSLLADGLLPHQPHLDDKLDEFRAYCQLSEIEGAMPSTVVAGN